MSLRLVSPNLENVNSYLTCMREMVQAGEKVWPPTILRSGESLEDFVARLTRAQTLPEPGMVPESHFWGLLNGEVVGRIAVRHVLNDQLEKFGGHIGYEVRPRARLKGHASEMLRLVLQTAEVKKIGRVLLTCAPDNAGSNKTILKNGGRLEKNRIRRIDPAANQLLLDRSNSVYLMSIWKPVIVWV